MAGAALKQFFGFEPVIGFEIWSCGMGGTPSWRDTFPETKIFLAPENRPGSPIGKNRIPPILFLGANW